MHFLARRGQEIPFGTKAFDVLPECFAAAGIFGVVVERPAVISHLRRAVLALNAGKEVLPNLDAGFRLACCRQWRPHFGALVVARTLCLLALLGLVVGLEHVERPALLISEIGAVSITLLYHDGNLFACRARHIDLGSLVRTIGSIAGRC